jgi:hypothetical protein
MKLRNDDWRAAWLRGVAAQPGGPHALVTVSAGQVLCVPVAHDELPGWQRVLGQRVWVNLQAQPLRMAAQRPMSIGGVHG